jgi:hypothetical protein
MSLDFNLFGYFSDLRESVTISGETVNAIVSSSQQNPGWTEDGLEPGYDLSLICLISDFTTKPVVGETATVRTKTYRIVRIETDPKNIAEEYFLGEQYAR